MAVLFEDIYHIMFYACPRSFRFSFGHCTFGSIKRNISLTLLNDSDSRMEFIQDVMLKHRFNFELKSQQIEVIENIINNKNVVGILPTGYGKSMCFILPPLITGKISIVISPLRSLMFSQAADLQKRGIKAICVTKLCEMTSCDIAGMYFCRSNDGISRLQIAGRAL